MSLVCVIDASVVVRLFIADALSARAIALFDQLGATSSAIFHAPDLVYSETESVLRKRALVSHYPNIRRDMVRLYDFPFEVTSCRDLMIDAATISLARVISSYDAFYVALGARTGAPLVTADEKLVRALTGIAPYDVRSLATFAP